MENLTDLWHWLTNFEVILTLLTFISGIICLTDLIFFAPKRKKERKDLLNHPNHTPHQRPWLVDYAYSFFPVFLLVLVIRSFIFEPFRIPSGSLEPTLNVGDFILVNKYDYGLRLPVLHTKILSTGTPKRGDIMVFRWPVDPNTDYIKRVIGIPGDRVSYINKQLFINGEAIPQQGVGESLNMDENNLAWPVLLKNEDLLGIKHDIYVRPTTPAHDFTDVIVPEGNYFVMGDNRDNSSDSRYWGFVPEENLLGKAILIWFSWDSSKNEVRFKRMGKMIN